jgi:hypothetical protein
MAIEKFTPNIKNPGINKATGAYARGDVGQEADWSKVYEAIDKSVQGMMGAIGQTIAIDKALLKTLNDKDDQFKKGIANLQESGNNALDKSSDEIISNVSGGEKTEWFQLNRRERKEAISKLNDVQGVKNVITSVVSDIGTGNINDLNWSSFSKNTKVKSFFNHIMNNEAEVGSDLFTLDTSGKSPVIKFAGQELDFQDLQSGATIFKSGKEMKKSIKGLLDTSVDAGLKRRESLASKTDGVGGGKAMDMDRFLQESRDNIKNLSETEDNYEFIFNNLTHVIDPSNRATIYDSNNPKHVEDVEKYIDDYIRNGMGENPQIQRSAEAIQKAKDRAQGKTNLGGRSIDADVIERARGLVPVLQGLTSHTDKPSGPVETISRDEYLQIKKSKDNENSKESTRKLFSEINSARGFLQNGDTYLNNLVTKYNEGGMNNLGAEEKDVMSAYLKFKGQFDEQTDLTQYFDPSAIDRSAGVNYNRIDKIITLKLPGAEAPQEFDLKNKDELQRISELMMKVTGLNQVEGGYALKYLFGQSGKNNIFSIDPNKPKLQ